MEQDLRILHCVTDEKFIDGMIDQTQTFWTDCNHVYAVIGRSGDKEYKFIHNKDAITCVQSQQVANYIKQNGINVVILHNLYSIPYVDLSRIPQGVKVVWFAWGMDLYYSLYNILRPLIKRELYYPKIRRALRTGLVFHKNGFRRVAGTIKNSFYFRRMKRAISRIDYFSGVIPEEYNLIVEDKNNYFFKAKPMQFSYSSLRNSFTDSNLQQPVAEGCDIQIGNSGDPTNNHIDVMVHLQQLNIGNKKIHCPLSYAGSELYRQRVQNYGESAFGDNFIAHTVFVPLDEYKKILASTRYSIFAMERQQAMGNVIMALWNGRMVFLSEKNPAYISLKNRGYIVYTIQDDLGRIERSETMRMEDIIKNRKLLIESHSVDAERKKAQKIISELRDGTI